LASDSAEAQGSRDKKARDGPDGLVVHRFQYARCGEARIFLSRRESAPTDRLPISVGQQTRPCASVHQRLHRLAIALAFLGAPLRRRQSRPHTPATSTCAVLAEEPFKIRPPPGRKRMNFNFQCGLGLLIYLKRFHGLILSSADSRLPAFGAELAGFCVNSWGMPGRVF
jgi:hypothetical protein